MDSIASGAEADISRGEFLGRRAVFKVRRPKGYRDPDLDRRIRSQRTRAEARLLREARSAGIRTPVIYSVDLPKAEIVMEDVGGETVKARLHAHPEEADEICAKVGSTLARLHNARISHGDLTTSNIVMLPDGRMCFIDFSMGTSLATTEDMGTDVRLLERAFSSAHPGLEGAYQRIVDAYRAEKNDAEAVLGKVQEIKDRGRYT